MLEISNIEIGPIIGGFMAARTTWRWMFWSTSIFQAVMIIVSFFSFPESYAPVILHRRAKRLRMHTGNAQYYTEGERLHGERSPLSVVGRALTRPLRLLAFHPIIQVIAVLSGFNYGILYIILSTFSDLWKNQYHQSTEISGLHYIACSLGEVLGSQLGGPLMDRLYKRSQKHGGTPESRLPLIFLGVATTWSGALMYGWVARYTLFWPVVDLGVIIMMFGMQLSSLPGKYYSASLPYDGNRC